MQRTESETLEFKASFGEWKEAIRTLCGFANKDGGTVVVGFDNLGDHTNLRVGSHTIEDFVNKLKTNTDPVLYPSICVRTFALGEIVEISIPRSDYKPVFAFGKAYSRVGRSTVQLSAAEIREMSRANMLPDFDRQPSSVSLTDFMVDNEVVKRMQAVDPLFTFPRSLIDLNLMNDQVLLNAAYLCFAKENKRYANAIVKAARFKGNDVVTFIDMKEFTSNLVVAVDDVLAFVMKHTDMSVVIENKPTRTERWDYPIPALREAIINAIVHRDYSDSGNIQVRIFDNRLELWSPGTLPSEIPLEDIGVSNRSIPKNRLLADVFHHLKLIERWGTGFSRIIDLCIDHGIGKPTF
jgi:ATP-dependent DNA helicase RecG